MLFSVSACILSPLSISSKIIKQALFPIMTPTPFAELTPACSDDTNIPCIMRLSSSSKKDFPEPAGATKYGCGLKELIPEKAEDKTQESNILEDRAGAIP